MNRRNFASIQDPGSLSAGIPSMTRLNPWAALDVPPPSPLRLMLLVRSLEFRELERQAMHLANLLDPARFDVAVCALSDDPSMHVGLCGRDQRPIIVPTTHWYGPKTVRGLAQVMQRCGTQIVHAFHPTTAVVSRLAALRFGVPFVVYSKSAKDDQQPMLQRAALRLSRPLCDAWIADSRFGSGSLQQQLGLPKEFVFVVHMVVDTGRFQPMDSTATRKSLGVRGDELAVGVIGHSATSANQNVFQQMVPRVAEKFSQVRFVRVGTGPEPLVATVPPKRDVYPVSDTGGDESNRSAKAESSIRGDRVIIADGQLDRVAVYSAMDLAVVTSSHEGNMGAVLELMACETPAVISDVADHALAVRDGHNGFVIDVNDHEAMARRVLDLLGDSSRRARMGRDAREHVVREFSASAFCKRTEAVYEAVWRRECPQLPYSDRSVAV